MLKELVEGDLFCQTKMSFNYGRANAFFTNGQDF